MLAAEKRQWEVCVKLADLGGEFGADINMKGQVR